MARSSVHARLAAHLRFDSLGWRKFAYLGCVYGPEWWKRYSPPVFAAVIFALVKSNRQGAIANMQRVLGDSDRRRAGWAALRMFTEYSHCFTETMEYYGPHPEPIRLDIQQHDHLADALREGHGAVMVTGHFGNWDVAAKALRDYGRPINVVMAREVNATTHEYVRGARERGGVRVLYSDSSVFSSLNMIRALQRNEIVAIQLDRSLGGGGTRMVPFFGQPAPFPSGPFVLARLSGAPVIPVFFPRLGTRHYAIRVCGRFNLAREARDRGSLDAVMNDVVLAFERVVRKFPTQWFQFPRFWPDASAGGQEPSLSEDARPLRRATGGADAHLIGR